MRDYVSGMRLMEIQTLYFYIYYYLKKKDSNYTFIIEGKR